MSEQKSEIISDEGGLPSSAIRDLETVFDGRVWDVVSKTFDFENEVLVREYIKHPGAVAVLAINELDEVLLIKQYRAPVNEFLYEMPAGIRDSADESDLHSAQRELAEETDYQANSWSHLHSFYTTPGSSSEIIEIFLAQDLNPTGTTFERTSEEKTMIPIWVPFTDVLQAVMTSKVKSPTLVVAVLSFAAQRNQDG